MLKKKCPWCNNSITFRQLGRRPYKTKPKWFHITREQQVCPYCANGVKFSGKAVHALWLIAPLLLTNLAHLIFGKATINANLYNAWLFLLAVIGLVVFMLMSTFTKDEKI